MSHLLPDLLSGHVDRILNQCLQSDGNAQFTPLGKPDGLGGFTNELDAPSSKVDPDAKTVEDAQKSAAWTVSC